jgi:hypothetical protein
MPMVQISHARLSSLVCDGNKGRGKIVVGVAAHCPGQVRASRVHCASQKSGNGLLLLLLEADHGRRQSFHFTIVIKHYIDVYMYTRVIVGAHGLLIFLT